MICLVHTCFKIFCSLMSFCRSLLGLLTMISKTSCPLFGMSTTKKTRSSRSLVTNLQSTYSIQVFSKRQRLNYYIPIIIKKNYTFSIQYDILSILSILFTDLRSFCVIVPFSSLPAMDANTLLASLAKSRSRTSAGGTGTMAKASLSSFTADVPIWKMY